MRRIVPVLSASAALLALGLTACSSGAPEATATETVTQEVTVEATAPEATAQAPAPTTDSPVPTTAGGTAAAPTKDPQDAIDSPHSDSYRTILTVDREGLGELTGIAVTTANLDELRAVLAKPATWKANDLSVEHADLIAKGIKREKGSTTGALRAVIKSDDAKMRIDVEHHRHANIAHIGVKHDD